MRDYTDLINRLRAYAADRKGEIAELTEGAADAIKELAERFPDVKKTSGGGLISRQAALDRLDYRQAQFVELGPEYFTALRNDIRALPTMEREEWISAETPPVTEHTKEYLVRDFAGIISTRLYHPGKGWGKPGRAPHDDVAEWREL